MQVKKFEATSMQEALRVIKREMGPNAIILSVKENRKRFGIMSKASVEVTAAVAEKDIINSNEQKPEVRAKKIPVVKDELDFDIIMAEARRNVDDTQFNSELRPFPEGQISMKEPEAKLKPKPLVASEPSQSNDTFTEQQDFNREEILKDIKQENKSMLEEISELKQIIKQISYENVVREKENFWKSNDITNEVMDAYHQLLSAGIEKRFARELIKDLDDSLDAYGKLNFDAVIDGLALILMKKIKVTDPLGSVFANNGKPSILAFVGPTGVGKTTTLAKIASQAISKRRLKVGLINLDNFKVSADDQLSTYAKIIDIPFCSAKSKEELLTVVESFSNLDLILIDTTGVSQKDQETLTSLKQTLSVLGACEKMLMISSTTKETDVNDIMNRFMLFKPSSIICSKLDETSVYGSIYNMQARTSLPLSYFTVGQRVPEDIEKATVERLVDLILKL